jgi:hypothetical protein
MISQLVTPDASGRSIYGFRPWVRRAGASIVLVSAAITAAITLTLVLVPRARYGWIGEGFVWVYVGTLWLGGLKVWTGTRRPIAEIDPQLLVLRPLHQFRTSSVAWRDVRGTEQMQGGDRLIVYFDTPRGMRFVALNLNLIRGRRDFLLELERRLRGLDFIETVVERSRYLSRPA